MDEGRATLMQMQVRRNAEDLQSYLNDLESWEDIIKKKDEGLSRQKPILKEQLPPVRSRHSKSTKTKTKKKKKKETEGESKNTKPKRITSSDYNAWDKFDVDKACEAVDYEVHSTDSSSEEEEEEEDEEDEEIRRKQRAVMEKDKGNELFKKGAYEAAVERYSVAMELDPTSAVLPANRALALLKLERYAAAETDCSVALELDHTYVKAYLRRATVRLKLKNPQAARQDFESVLKLEPGNKVARTELARLDKELGLSGLRYIRAVKRPPHLRSKKPLKRILVEDTGVVAPGNIGTSDPVPLIEDLTERSSCSSSTTGNTSDVSCVGRDVATSSSELIPQACMISESSSGKGSTVERPLESQSELASAIASGTEPSPGLPGNVGSKMTVVSDVASGLQQLHQDKGQQDKGQQSGGVSSGCKGRRPVEVPGVPHTSLQFQADWRQLRGDRDRMAEYFKAIPVSKYSVILQQSLETDVFSDIITILHNKYVKCGQSCLEELQGLVKVQRFSVAIMFLSTKQKEDVISLFKDLVKLVSDNEQNGRTASDLAKAYCASIT